jgi:hypothetical protein
MQPKLLLRIAATFMLLHTIGHTFGALTWKNAPNATIARLVSDMINDRFDFMGRSVSVALFFEGYGIILIFVLLLVSLCLWLIGDDVETRLAQRFLVIFACFLLVVAITEFMYFFAMAALFTLLAGVCVTLATVQQRSQRVVRAS